MTPGNDPAIRAASPESGVKDYVVELARQHGVRYIRTPADALAEGITRLAGDDVATDVIEDLIVALKRARVIDGPAMVSLLGNYLNERRNAERPCP
jgi:hypothetical protein